MFIIYFVEFAHEISAFSILDYKYTNIDTINIAWYKYR